MIAAAIGYTRPDKGGIRPKQYRPKTINDAKVLIIEVFSRQRPDGWDERDIRVYFENKGIPKARVEDLTPDEVRIVVEALEKSKMLIFKD